MPKVVGQDETVYKRITCRNCGAINEYTPNELRDIKTNYDYLGDFDTYKGFNCAGCGEEVYTERW